MLIYHVHLLDLYGLINLAKIIVWRRSSLYFSHDIFRDDAAVNALWFHPIVEILLRNLQVIGSRCINFTRF